MKRRRISVVQQNFHFAIFNTKKVNLIESKNYTQSTHRWQMNHSEIFALAKVEAKKIPITFCICQFFSVINSTKCSIFLCQKFGFASIYYYYFFFWFDEFEIYSIQRSKTNFVIFSNIHTNTHTHSRANRLFLLLFAPALSKRTVRFFLL